MAQHTSFAIGGPADLLVEAHCSEELAELLRLARESKVPALLIGGGTNILVADAGVRGIVIANACRGWNYDEAEGLLTAHSGAPLCQVAQGAVQRGLGGLEWAVGIPGTLGGAVVGNAGAYGGCMADVVRRVTLLRPDGQIETVEAAALEYTYRNSALKREARRERRPVVLEATLRLIPEDAAALAQKAASFTEQRLARTPCGCCAGSVFKRTLQYPPGFLIEQAGLKGRRIGGAEVSPKHANFLMNVGGASARDMRALMELVQREVLAAFGQQLEPEIEFVGAW
jgi:UDP-N-acetylmuramate dehydrogenase